MELCEAGTDGLGVGGAAQAWQIRVHASNHGSVSVHERIPDLYHGRNPPSHKRGLLHPPEVELMSASVEAALEQPALGDQPGLQHARGPTPAAA